MTSQKRKSSVAGNTAKRQKIRECESHSNTPKKRPVSSKAKTSPHSAEKKKTPKAPSNKAIRNSKTSKAKTERKGSTVLNTTKKSAVNIVPAKSKSLRLAKEVTSLKKSTQKSSNSPLKAQKKNQPKVGKTVAKESSVQNKSKKITKSTSKSPASTQPKTVKCVKKNVRTKIGCKSNLKVVGVKKNVNSANRGTSSKSSQKKARKCDVQSKCNKQAKKDINIKKPPVSSLERQVPVRNATVKKSEVEPKTKAHNPTRDVQKVSGTCKMGTKPSQSIVQQSVASAVTKKRSEDKTKQESTKTVTKNSNIRQRGKIRNAEVNSETSSKLVKRIKSSIKCDSAPNNTLEEEIAGDNLPISCSTNEMLDSSLSDKTSSEDTVVVVNTSSSAPLKRKRNIKSMDNATKTKAKKQKIGQSEANKTKDTPEANPKSKRVSILDLCNEIAGEIESDTVEVVKVPSSPTSPPKEKVEEENVQNLPDVSSPVVEKSPVNQLKRFFPSRKPVSKLEKKTSPGARNSKWSKIKLKNSFAQNNILRKRAVLPSLEAIKAKALPGRQLAPGIPVSPKTSDTTLLTQSKQTRSAQKAKDNTSQILGSGDVLEKTSTKNGLMENHIKYELEAALDEGFRLHLDSSPENSPLKKTPVSSAPEFKPSVTQSNDCKQLTDQMAPSAGRGVALKQGLPEPKPTKPISDGSIQKEIRKLKEASSDSKQSIIDAGQKRFGAISCCVCGMLYTASNPEDEAQHLLFHNQFISAVKYVGWKKERIVAEYPDGKVIMVLPDDPKYALKKVQEIREMVDNDLGFQQVPLRLHSRTKTLMFINSEKKIVGCLIAEHIQWGYRVIDDYNPVDQSSETEKLFSERVKAWCCCTTPEPAICGVSRIWVFSVMRRKKIASRMLECLRNHFIYGSHLNKDEIAFSDPTPDGKLFATNYCGTSQFLVYNFVSGHHPQS